MEIDRRFRELEEELDQHRALLSALVQKAGITAADLLPYIEKVHPSPTGAHGDDYRASLAERTVGLVSSEK